MYYKVTNSMTKDIVDVIKEIHYIQYQEKHKILILCDIKIAQAILSSDGKKGWHIEGLYNFPLDNTIYEIEPISRLEYEEIDAKLHEVD